MHVVRTGKHGHRNVTLCVCGHTVYHSHMVLRAGHLSVFLCH